MCCYKLLYSSYSNIFCLHIPFSFFQFLDISQGAVHHNLTGTFLCKFLSNLFKFSHSQDKYSIALLFYLVQIYIHDILSFFWRCCPTWVMTSSFMSFLDHTQRLTTVGRTPLDE